MRQGKLSQEALHPDECSSPLAGRVRLIGRVAARTAAAVLVTKIALDNLVEVFEAFPDFIAHSTTEIDLYADSPQLQ